MEMQMHMNMNVQELGSLSKGIQRDQWKLPSLTIMLLYHDNHLQTVHTYPPPSPLWHSASNLLGTKPDMDGVRDSTFATQPTLDFRWIILTPDFSSADRCIDLLLLFWQHICRIEPIISNLLNDYTSDFSLPWIGITFVIWSMVFLG